MSLPHQRCWSLRLVLVLLAISAGVVAEVASGGELLYNGIRLPDTWPPRLSGLGREPMPVPYLKRPPEVISIDVGRPEAEYDAMFSEVKRAYGLAGNADATETVIHDGPHKVDNEAAFEWMNRWLEKASIQNEK